MENKLDLIKTLLKNGVSTLIATSGIILIYLGCTGKAFMPESLWAGIGIIGFALIWLTLEYAIKFYKLTKIVNKLKEKTQTTDELINLIQNANNLTLKTQNENAKLKDKINKMEKKTCENDLKEPETQ